MNLTRVCIVTAIVLAISIYGSYWQSVSPYLTLMLHDAGYTNEDIGRFLSNLSILSLIVGYGSEILNLVASYYLGKHYRLTKTSALAFLILLIVTIWIGNLIGYIIRQIELPRYSILNINFFIYTLTAMIYPVLWSLVGVLTGNYKRTREEKTSSSIG